MDDSGFLWAKEGWSRGRPSSETALQSNRHSLVVGVRVGQRSPGFEESYMPSSSGARKFPTQLRQALQQTFAGLFFRSPSTG